MSKRTESEQKAWQDGYTEGQADEAEDAVKEIQKAREESYRQGFAAAMLERDALREKILDALIDWGKVAPEDVRKRLREAVGRVE